MRPEESAEISEMIQDCLDRDNQLSDWETDFIHSLDDQLSNRDWISEKQYNILEKIWNRVTARG